MPVARLFESRSKHGRDHLKGSAGAAINSLICRILRSRYAIDAAKLSSGVFLDERARRWLSGRLWGVLGGTTWRQAFVKKRQREAKSSKLPLITHVFSASHRGGRPACAALHLRRGDWASSRRQHAIRREISGRAAKMRVSECECVIEIIISASMITGAGCAHKLKMVRGFCSPDFFHGARKCEKWVAAFLCREASNYGAAIIGEIGKWSDNAARL